MIDMCVTLEQMCLLLTDDAWVYNLVVLQKCLCVCVCVCYKSQMNEKR